MEASFLRQSRRLNPDLGGFRDSSSRAVVVLPDAPAPVPTSLGLNPSVYTIQPTGEASSGAAPHLSLDNIQGIATGFLQMQPEAVSTSALLDLDLDVDA